MKRKGKRKRKKEKEKEKGKGRGKREKGRGEGKGGLELSEDVWKDLGRDGMVEGKERVDLATALKTGKP